MNANRKIDVDLESTLEEFESSWSAANRPAIKDFLPDPSHPKFLEILAELIRCDMEFAWDAGIRDTTENLTEPFPIIRESRESLEAIAFEEYRLRHAAGESTSPVDFQRRLGISTTDWPTWKPIDSSGIFEKRDLPSFEDSSGPDSISRSRIKRHPDRALNFPSIGSQFCGFEIVGELGRGAFGRVFLARQDDMANRFVALKVTCQHSDEHQYLAQLQHTNIVPVYSVHRSGNLQAICMPFLGVVTLRDVQKFVHSNEEATNCPKPSHALVSTIAKQKAETIVETIKENDERQSFRQIALADDRMTVEEKTNETYRKSMANTVMQLSRGLGYAHERGIVHGDLKPANVLLSDDGHPLLLDFHLSKSVDDIESENVGGTLPYMSPEHLRSLQTGEPIDARADVYSMGVILHEMLSGDLPFDSSIKEDLETEIPELIQLRNDVVGSRQKRKFAFGVDIDSIIDKCLQPNPDSRYKTATELADDLQLHLHDRPLVHTKNRSVVELGRKWFRRHPRLTSVTSIAVVSLIVVAILSAILFSFKLKFDRSRALEKLANFRNEATYAKLDIFVDDGLEPAICSDAIDNVRHVLDQYNCSSIEELRESRNFHLLDPEKQLQQARTISELYFWIAVGQKKLAHFGDQAFSGKVSLLNDAMESNKMASQFLSDNSVGLLAQKAQILTALGQRQEAEVLKDELFTKPISNSMDRLMLAYVIQDEDYEKAIQLLTEYIAGQPTDIAGWSVLGNVQHNNEKYVEAIRCYSICLTLEPDAPTAYRDRGVSYYLNGQYKESDVDLAKARELRPNNVDYILNHALALIKTKQWQLAEQALDKAIKLGSRQTRIWYLRSNVRKRLGDAKGGKEDFDKFMSEEPRDAISWTTRGVRKIKSAPLEAMADFEAALVQNPEYFDAHANIAHLQSEKFDDLAGAIKTMDRILELRPLDPAQIATRGVLHARNKNRELAIRDAKRAIEIRSDADTHYRIAGIYAQTSLLEPADSELALRHLATAALINSQTVLKLMKNDPDVKPLTQDPRFQRLIDSLRVIQNLGKNG